MSVRAGIAGTMYAYVSKQCGKTIKTVRPWWKRGKMCVISIYRPGRLLRLLDGIHTSGRSGCVPVLPIEWAEFVENTIGQADWWTHPADRTTGHERAVMQTPPGAACPSTGPHGRNRSGRASFTSKVLPGIVPALGNVLLFLTLLCIKLMVESEFHQMILTKNVCRIIRSYN